MKKHILKQILGVLACQVLLLSACSATAPKEDTQMTESEMQETTVSEQSVSAESSAEESIDPIREAIRQETAEVDTTPAEADENEDRVPTAELPRSSLPSILTFSFVKEVRSSTSPTLPTIISETAPRSQRKQTYIFLTTTIPPNSTMSCI